MATRGSSSSQISSAADSTISDVAVGSNENNFGLPLPSDPSSFAAPQSSLIMTTMTIDEEANESRSVANSVTTDSYTSSFPERAWERRLRAKQSGAASELIQANDASSNQTTTLDRYQTPGAFRVTGMAGSDAGANDSANNEISWRSSTTDVAISDVDLIPVQAELAPEEFPANTTPSSSPPVDDESVIIQNNNMTAAAGAYGNNVDAPDMVISVEAVKDDNDGDRNRSRMWWWWFGGSLLAVVVVAVVVTLTVVLTSSPNNNDNPTPAPSPSPTSSPTPGAALMAGLPTNLTLRGSTLNGLALLPSSKNGTNSQFGASVALDATGTILAVGAVQYTPINQTKLRRRAGLVQVYKYNDTMQQWKTLGDPIVGEEDQDYLGRSVALSNNGQVMAVGSFGHSNQAGLVRVYQYQASNASWIQLGNDLIGINDDEVGWGTMAFSRDGMILAYGALLNSFNATCQASGRVKIVVYDASRNVWKRRGQDLTGKDCQTQFGISVDLSWDGDIVAVGARYYNGSTGNLPFAGLVQVYKYQTETSLWQQLGQDIVGKQAGDRLGRAVSLSASGSTLCVGASQADANGTNVPGYAQIYTLQENEWSPQGPVLFGNNTGDYFGGNVALSADGTIAVVCARQSNSSEELLYRGYCQLYALDRTTDNNASNWEAIGHVLRGQLNYDQFGGALALSADGKIVAVGAAQDTANQTAQQGYVQVWEAVQNL